jgi:nitrite reductase/ring-hydroxylating ferredoxin subunit/DMSO/TMAO reductase YedYZ heme-binding membrane subunit
MSVQYRPVGWTRFKMQYDAVLLGGVVVYLLAYIRLGPKLASVTRPLDGQTLAMDAYGTCAFLLLTLALCIGPLARLDRRFLPLLYNRRHLGVLTAVVATAHAQAVLGWYFAYSPTDPYVALLGADTGSGHLLGFPFIPFGIFSLVLLWLLAATSHDFWLRFLTPPLWKALHLGIYAAYASLVLHFSLGALQDAKNPILPVLCASSVALVCGLHVAAARRDRTAAQVAAQVARGEWVRVGPADAVAEDRARIVRLPGGAAVAVFRHAGGFSALANLCAHQNGPLGEGQVIDGLIVCPWHGYQYRPEDGCSPPPFTERVATYALRAEGKNLFVAASPNPPGTRTPPLVVS